MSVQDFLVLKTLSTRRTLEGDNEYGEVVFSLLLHLQRFHAAAEDVCVHLLVLEKLLGHLEGLGALMALEGFLLRVGELMDFQVRLLSERFPAKCAGERLLACVNH